MREKRNEKKEMGWADKSDDGRTLYLDKGDLAFLRAAVNELQFPRSSGGQELGLIAEQHYGILYTHTLLVAIPAGKMNLPNNGSI